MAKRIRKPPGFNLPGDKPTSRKSAGGKPPKRFRRLRVVAEPNVPGGAYPPVRDVYLESSHCPLMSGTLFDNVSVDLFQYALPVEIVADLIRQMELWEIPVVYEPPGNMAGYVRPPSNGQTPLFT